MPKANHSAPPSTPTTYQQFFRVLKHEPAGFIPRLLANTAQYATHKYLLQKPTLTKQIHNFKMQFDLTDPGISRSLLIVGDREREHRYMLTHSIQPSQTILDLGANIGYYVLMEQHLLQGTGHVVAIEPHPSNISHLMKNIALNQQQANTTVIHAAVSDQDGQIQLHTSKLSNVHSLLAKTVPAATGTSLTVPALSVATLSQRWPDAALIRMDVEGYEQVILQALINLNKNKKSLWLPQILFELHPATYNEIHFSKLLSGLYALGYHARYLACSHLNQLENHNLEVIASIPTDGTIRHIAKDVPLEIMQSLFMHSRAVLLARS